MRHHPTQDETVGEFLRLRSNVRHDTAVLEKLDDQLRDLTHTNPDQANDILHTLSHSDVKDDRGVAAIYVGHLLATRPDDAQNIIQLLLHDTDPDIRRQTHDTLNTALDNHTITATQAAHLIGAQE